jgi:hypothetical protein
MHVRVADLSNFDEELALEESVTIGDLKSIVSERFSFDTAPCLVFSEDHREMSDRDPVFPDGCPSCPFYVFYSQAVYHEKAYPAVDGAFRFPATRFARADDDFAADIVRRPFGLGRMFEFPRSLDGFPPDFVPQRAFRLRSPPASSSDDADSPDIDIDTESDSDAIWRMGARRAAGHPVLLYARRWDDGGPDDFDGGEGSEEEEQRTAETRMAGISVDLTSDDTATVQRLARLGFDPRDVVQVYVACGRDEAVTQQCLLSGGFR